MSGRSVLEGEGTLNDSTGHLCPPPFPGPHPVFWKALPLWERPARGAHQGPLPPAQREGEGPPEARGRGSEMRASAEGLCAPKRPKDGGGHSTDAPRVTRGRAEGRRQRDGLCHGDTRRRREKRDSVSEHTGRGTQTTAFDDQTSLDTTETPIPKPPPRTQCAHAVPIGTEAARALPPGLPPLPLRTAVGGEGGGVLWGAHPTTTKSVARVFRGAVVWDVPWSMGRIPRGRTATTCAFDRRHHNTSGNGRCGAAKPPPPLPPPPGGGGAGAQHRGMGVGGATPPPAQR